MRRKRRLSRIDEEHQSNERWLVSYADFITLLFAFFVAMYAISSVNEGKYRVLSSSIVEAFNNPQKKEKSLSPGEYELEPTPSDVISPIELDHVKKDSMVAMEDDSVPAQEAVIKSDKQPRGTQDEIGGGQMEMSAADIAADIEQEMSELIDEGAVSVRNSDDWIEVEIKNNVLFPSGSARLHTDALPILKSLSSILIEFSNPIQVEGFTDNQPIKTLAFPSNWELSAARAASVVHLLMKVGVKPERMAAVGYGEHRPIADNETEQGRQRNRRVVIIIPTVDTGGHIANTKPGEESRRGHTGQKRISVDPAE